MEHHAPVALSQKPKTNDRSLIDLKERKEKNTGNQLLTSKKAFEICKTEITKEQILDTIR